LRLNQETIKLFQPVSSENQEIRLVNVYKGIPISYPATILEISSDTMHIKTSRIQVVCLYRDRETYIQSEYPRNIHARVKDVNLVLSEVILHQFDYVNVLGTRTNVRVEPGETVQGQVLTGGKTPVICGLADISLDGMGIYIDEAHFSPTLFAVGSEITIHITIPAIKSMQNLKSGNDHEQAGEQQGRFSRSDLRGIPNGEQNSWIFRSTAPAQMRAAKRDVMLTGKIVNFRHDQGERRYRAGIKINPSDPQRDIISQFIVQRQSEILNEIRQLASM
jgi:hypothetical protein